jgi:hypothetical protein
MLTDAWIKMAGSPAGTSRMGGKSTRLLPIHLLSDRAFSRNSSSDCEANASVQTQTKHKSRR